MATMETVTIYYIPAIISAAATAFFTIISAGLVHRMNKKLKTQDERETKEETERFEKEQQRQDEHDAIVNGLQALLRNELIDAYHHYEEKGELPIYAMENIQKMYDAYHNLGGNGTITKLYNKLQKLPQGKEVDRE